MSDRKVSSRDKAVAEIFGTFSLVFSGTGAIVINDTTGGSVTHAGVALTFGLVVLAMIYAVGDVSGAHLNPAVTFGFWLSKRLPTSALPLYLGSQFIGAMAASLLLRFMFRDHPTLGATIPVGPDSRSFLLEVVLTAMLMFVILAVSTGSKEKGLMAGIAVGGVIAFEAMFAGPISGASMNPIRSLAPAVVSGCFESLWVYLTAPLVGAAVGLICFRGTQSSSGSLAEPSASIPDEPSPAS